MKRYLNLNEPGARIFLTGILLGGIIPGFLGLVRQLLGALGIACPWLAILMGVFFGVGGLFLGTLFVLVILEAIQDRILTRQILRQRKRIPLGNGMYECPFCGNRQVREYEKTCPVCHQDVMIDRSLFSCSWNRCMPGSRVRRRQR